MNTTEYWLCTIFLSFNNEYNQFSMVFMQKLINGMAKIFHFNVNEVQRNLDNSNNQTRGEFVRISEGFELLKHISVGKYAKAVEIVRLEEEFKLQRFNCNCLYSTEWLWSTQAEWLLLQSV